LALFALFPRDFASGIFLARDSNRTSLSGESMRQTIVGLFRDPVEAQVAVRDLKDAGFADDHVSLVTREESADQATADREPTEGTAKGAALGGVAGALLGVAAFAIPGIGPVLAIGPLAAALTGAGLGAATGGMLGALADMGVPEREAQRLTDALREGGTLVVVNASDKTFNAARTILDQHGALDPAGVQASNEPHRDAANFGDEGGASEWGGRPSRTSKG
jgi:hypothetical protein